MRLVQAKFGLQNFQFRRHFVRIPKYADSTIVQSASGLERGAVIERVRGNSQRVTGSLE
jgi:hypothetical protein